MFENVPTGKSSHLLLTVGTVDTFSGYSLLYHDNMPCLSSVSAVERQQVLGALERLQAKLVQREEWTHSETMGNLRETLQSPLFSHILTLQHSIKQLRNQVSNKKHTSCSSEIRSDPSQHPLTEVHL